MAEIIVPNDILVPAQTAIVILDRLTAGKEPGDELQMLPPVGSLDEYLALGVRLAREHGQTGKGTYYHTGPIDIGTGVIELQGRGIPISGHPAELHISTTPPHEEGVRREFSFLDMAGEMIGTEGRVVFDASSLKLNDAPARPIVKRLVPPLLNYAKKVLPQM